MCVPWWLQVLLTTADLGKKSSPDVGRGSLQRDRVRVGLIMFTDCSSSARGFVCAR